MKTTEKFRYSLYAILPGVFSTLFTLFLFGVIGITACSDDDSPDDGSADVPGHREGVGSSANKFLSGSHFTELKVELWFVEGYAPTSSAISDLENFLRNRLNKPGGIEVVNAGTIPIGHDLVKAEYNVSDIRKLEDAFRKELPSKGRMTAFMVFLNGNSDSDDDNTRILGIAYNNTSTAIFEETVQDVSGDGLTAPQRSRVEKTVMKHEFGHILGLVDIGSPMQNNHKDKGAHCDNSKCLMYYKMNQDDLVDILLGGSDPEPDNNCILDLRANGGK